MWLTKKTVKIKAACTIFRVYCHSFFTIDLNAQKIVPKVQYMHVLLQTEEDLLHVLFS